MFSSRPAPSCRVASSRKRGSAFLFAVLFSLVAAGCHHRNNTSGYGIGWVTLTNDEPVSFASYIVTVDSVVLTGAVDGQVTAVATPEIVDFTKLKDVSELWSSASIPTDAYSTATITLDYSSAFISVLVNGVPQLATIHDSTGAVPTTISVAVNLDPVNKAYIVPTYATTSGIRMAIDMDLAASNSVDFTTSPATVTVKPYFTISTSAPDNKMILVRGPLVNTSLTEQTYSVYVRPFFDEVDTLGTLSMFDNASTFGASSTNTAAPTACPNITPLYTINGTSYTGGAGITQLSQTSAGSTQTASYTTYHPTVTPSATAAIFCTVYMIGGSTLEDFYTDGLEGDVIARSGNTLTVRAPTLAATAAEIVKFNADDAQVILGPGTLVTEDGVPANGTLNYNSVSVGQHIIARGIYSLPNNVVTLDATGTSSTNTGSLRIQPVQAFGSLISSTAGSLEINLANIGIYPASVFNFAGTGTNAATDAVPGGYLINTGAETLPTDLTAGGPVFADGIIAPFGSAPPDFDAAGVEDEGSLPATIVVSYAASNANTAPFAPFAASGLGFNLGNSLLVSAQIHIGAEIIDMTTLPASPTVISVTVPSPPLPVQVATPNLTDADLPPVFLPLFAYGSTLSGINCYNTLSQFIAAMNTAFAAATPASVLTVTAQGTYDRVNNLFTASAFHVVLD